MAIRPLPLGVAALLTYALTWGAMHETAAGPCDVFDPAFDSLTVQNLSCASLRSVSGRGRRNGRKAISCDLDFVSPRSTERAASKPISRPYRDIDWFVVEFCTSNEGGLRAVFPDSNQDIGERRIASTHVQVNPRADGGWLTVYFIGGGWARVPLAAWTNRFCRPFAGIPPFIAPEERRVDYPFEELSVVNKNPKRVVRATATPHQADSTDPAKIGTAINSHRRVIWNAAKDDLSPAVHYVAGVGAEERFLVVTVCFEGGNAKSRAYQTLGSWRAIGIETVATSGAYDFTVGSFFASGSANYTEYTDTFVATPCDQFLERVEIDNQSATVTARANVKNGTTIIADLQTPAAPPNTNNRRGFLGTDNPQAEWKAVNVDVCFGTSTTGKRFAISSAKNLRFISVKVEDVVMSPPKITVKATDWDGGTVDGTAAGAGTCP